MSVHYKQRYFELGSSSKPRLIEHYDNGTSTVTSNGTAPEENNESKNKSIVNWNYDCGIQGYYCPKNWVQIPSFPKDVNQCGAINSQSPVELTYTDHYPNVQLDYQEVNNRGKITNLGPIIRIECSGSNHSVVDGQTYQLRFIDLHTPAEHTIAQQTFDIEMQLVHTPVTGSTQGTSKYSYVIISVLLNGDDRAQGKATQRSIWDIINNGQAFVLPKDSRPSIYAQNMLNLHNLAKNVILDKNTYYYSYVGSLTIPPCTPNVRWVITVPTANSAKFDQTLRSIVGYNNRPLQVRSVGM